MSARKPRTRPKAAPQMPSSNMPIATAAAGRKSMFTPNSGRLANQESCTSRHRRI